MKTVRLYGELGKRFGRVHRLNVRSPGEAIRALIANHPGFERYMVEAESNKIGFRVINGTTELADVKEVRDPASGVIKIIPVVIGSSAFGRILIGVALIAAAVLLGPAGGAVIGSTFAGALTSVGIGLALGGVVQLLSPQPGVDEPQERPENDPSYLFNGPVNTTAQGQPVPICYGRLTVGGAVISAGISIEQLKSADVPATIIVLTPTYVTLWVSHFGPIVPRIDNYRDAEWFSDEFRTVPATPPAEITAIQQSGSGGTMPFYSDKYIFTYIVRTEVPA